MGLYNSYAQNDKFGFPSYGYTQDYSDYLGEPSTFDFMNPVSTPASGSLFSQFSMTPGTMKGIGSLMEGISGLYGMYLGKQQLDDQRANNSLYRRLANEQNQRRVSFENNTAKAFGSVANS